MENKRGWTKVSNFAELREKLTPEPAKAVQNFLSAWAERPQRPATSQVSSRQSGTRTGANKDKKAPVDGRGDDVNEQTKKQRIREVLSEIRQLEREISRVSPASEKTRRKWQRMISQGKIPRLNKPTKKQRQKWRRLKDELDQLYGYQKQAKPAKESGTSERSAEPKKKKRNSGASKGHYGGIGGYSSMRTKEKRYWWNEE